MRIWAAPKDGTPKRNETVIILSRVMEKCTDYLISCLHKLFLDKPYLTEYKNISIWSDGAPNMKGTRMAGTVGYNISEQYKFLSVRLSNLAPHHSKTELDGVFGTLKKKP